MASSGGGVVVGPDEIVANARDRGVPVDLLSDLGPIRTVVEASEAAGRSLAEVGNTVLVTIQGRPVLVVVPGDRALDGEAVGATYGADALEISLATQAEARELTGYDLGLIPPVGHEADCDLLVDRHLLDHERVLFPAGTDDTLLELDPRQLAALDDAEVGEWSRAKDEG
jgi:prolyl-tRNA editing enzyme YbaK/EbsC (Cys-tRNA(Pro) deacylase)